MKSLTLTRGPAPQGLSAASDWRLAALALLLGAGIVGFHVASAAAGYPAYRDIHLGTALEYAKGRIDLLRPMIVGFNASGTPTVQELPLWQAAVALVFKLTHSSWFGWGNVTSLLLFAAGLWPLFQVARSYLDARAAWWTVIFFLAQPLVVTMSGQAGTDGSCVVLMLWFLYAGQRLVHTGAGKWWLLAALFGCLTALTKLPFFMVAGIALFLLLLLDRERVRCVRSWVLLASVGAVGAVAFMLWSLYAAQQAALAEFPFVELRISRNPDEVAHFFGTWSYRLDPYNWAKGGWRVLNCTLGSFALVALPFGGLLLKSNRLPRYLLVGALVTTLIFTHLVLIHSHYYLMVCPAVALLCASAWRRVEQSLPPAWSQSSFWILGATAVLGLGIIQGLVGMKTALQFDRYPARTAALLRQYTRPTDKLIVHGGAWGGDELILSDRKGLSVEKLETLVAVCSGDPLRRLQELGYNRLVMMSESPLLSALQEVNPGSSYKRRCYPASVSPAVDAWPIVFQNADLVIKEIPALASAAK